MSAATDTLVHKPLYVKITKKVQNNDIFPQNKTLYTYLQKTFMLISADVGITV